MSFSFSFSGEDIEEDTHVDQDISASSPLKAAKEPTNPPPVANAATASAFPVKGKPQLPPQKHALKDMLARLPSKISYGLLDVTLDDDEDRSGDAVTSTSIALPRRELWDVRLQLMAEDDLDGQHEDESLDGSSGELAPGLGSHDVKTGIYEGGFKSWESSVDMVKVLLRPETVVSGSPSAERPLAAAAETKPSAVAAAVLSQDTPAHVIELGCGTALPSLALFQWACSRTSPSSAKRPPPLSITVADYNPSVLYLVTLPNFILTWALQQRNTSSLLQEAITTEEEDRPEDTRPEAAGKSVGGDLELTDRVKEAFCEFLTSSGISLSFLSGGWSDEFNDLLTSDKSGPEADSKAGATVNTLVLGAETIYSPFALEAFSGTLLAILRKAQENKAVATAIVAAKKLYFGVGGSLDDFVQRMRAADTTVDELREEKGGVHRGVVQCTLKGQASLT